MPPIEVKKPLAPDAQLSLVRFSPCGKVLAAAAHDGTVRRFDMTKAEPTELPKLAGHDGWVTALAFAPSGRLFPGDRGAN
jgi:WD40 repeat protein